MYTYVYTVRMSNLDCIHYYGILIQTLSESVSHALYLTGGSKAFETAYTIEKIDKFFDGLNVSYNQGKLKRKPFQQLYRSPNDFRLQVSTAPHV